jgi:uncharacterized membrane-anchored protein
MAQHAARFFEEPRAAKVPEITALFWAIKILTTAGGEATSDYLSLHNKVVGGAIEIVIFLIALTLQFRVRRYIAPYYWFLAYSIAIAGTGVADTMHLTIGLPYSVTTVFWALVLGLIFWYWQHSEGTLSIHSVVTQRREVDYWATVFATFALGTALGDFTAASLHLGYLASGVAFAVLITLPGLFWKFARLNEIAAFWMAYVLTRPLGASFADYFSKPHALSGANYGDGPTAVVLTIIIIVLVGYTTVARNDIQQPHFLERHPDT